MRPKPVDAVEDSVQGTRIGRRRLLGSVAAAASVGLPAARAQTTPAKRHLRFAYNGTGICTAAVPVALERGFYDKHGLEVEFVALAGDTDQMLQALATDKADVGSSMLLSWIKPLEQGFDVKLTTGLHGGCTRLMVDRSSGVTDITQLKGKTIGVSSLSGPPRHFFAILLSRHGIDADADVQWREYPGDLLPLAMQRGEVQAIADSDPAIWLARLRSNGALVEIASNLSDDYAHFSCCTLGVRASLFHEEPATAAALTQAVREGSAYVAAHPDEAAQIFAKYTPKVPVDQMAAMLRSHTHGHTPVGSALRSEFIQIATDLKHAGILKPSTDPARLANRVVVDVAV